MNILQLVPKLDVGGVEKGTVEIARFLTLNGHRAVVVSGGGKFEKKLAASGARHYTLPVGRKNPFVMLYCYNKLRRIIRTENIDIVHGRSRVPALIGYFASRSEKRVFITTAHGQYKKHFMSKVMGWGKIVIVASEVMALHMRENFGVSADKIVVIPRGVDLEKFAFLPPSDKTNRTVRAGMICRFTPLKGHLDFLKAAAYVSRKIPGFEVIIMGDRASARPEYLKKIELAIRHLLIEKIVKFETSDREVPEVMRELDILVSANREQEAFGRSIIEAQASGVPVVATRVGGIVDSIEDQVTGLLCEPGNPSDLSKKMIRYIENLALRQKIAEEARKNVERNFSIDRMMNLTLGAYENVLRSKKILVFKISSLGDIILSVPSLRALKKRFPSASIKVLVDVRFRKVLDRCPYVDEVIVCDFNGRDRSGGFFRLASRLRSEDFDISIDLQNSRKSHLLAILSMIPERYGYDNKKLSFFINRKAALPRAPLCPVDHQARVLGLSGVTINKKQLELWPDIGSENWVAGFLESNWLKPYQKLVGINVSASKKWKTKNWDLSSFVGFCDLLAKEKGIRVVLMGVEDDIPLAEEFMERSFSRPINAVGKTNIPRLISLIKRCNVIVSGDSSPIHIAAAVGTPFVALFGPTDPARHMPPSGKGKVVKKNARCAPCYKNVCHKGHRCMALIRPREVFEAAMDIMS